MPKTPGSKKGSHGKYTLLYVVVGVALVAALAFVVWNLYGQSQTKQQNNTTDTTQNKPIDSDVDTPNEVPHDDIVRAGDTFKIPELGIQFVLPEGLEGLEYEMIDSSYVDESGDHVNRQSAYFTTKTLRQADKHCKAGSIGAIGPIPLDAPQDDGAERWRVRLDNTALLFNGPQSVCSDRTDVGELQTRQVNILYESYKNTVTLITP